MARFSTTGLDELIADMRRLGEESGQLADEMLAAMAAEVQAAWKEAAEEAGLRATGDMINSIGFKRKPQTVNESKFIDVYPLGKDSKGVRNAEKAFIQHYGTSRISSTYFVDRADDLSGPTVQHVAEAKWDEYLKKRGF